MLRFLIRRVLLGALVLWIVTTGVFVLFFVTSPDPAARFAGKMATPETMALLRHRLGLDEPLPVQYWHFLTRLAHGDFGYSYQNRGPVSAMIVDGLPVSLSVAAGAAVLWAVGGLAFGMLCTAQARTALDRGVTSTMMAAVSTPTFIIGMSLSYALAFRLRIFPMSGFVPIQDDPLSWCRHLILPWTTLAISQAGLYTRLTRASMLDVLGEDYIRTARAKGLPEWKVIYRHGLRAALIPLVTQFGVDVGALIGGTLVTESVFGLQGLGQLTTRSMTSGDLPVIMAIVLISAFFVVLANVVVDVAYAYLDPRARLS